MPEESKRKIKSRRESCDEVRNTVGVGGCNMKTK